MKLPISLSFDETQNIATYYQAACTPDFYLFMQHQVLFIGGNLIAVDQK